MAGRERLINFMNIWNCEYAKCDTPEVREIKNKIQTVLDMENGGSMLAEIAEETRLSEEEIAYIVMIDKKIKRVHNLAKKYENVGDIKKELGLSEEEIVCILVKEKSEIIK